MVQGFRHDPHDHAWMEVKGEEGEEKREREMWCGFQQDQLDQAKQGQRKMEDDPLKIQIKSKRLECGDTCMAHAKIINAMFILVKTIISTWHYSYAFPKVD